MEDSISLLLEDFKRESALIKSNRENLMGAPPLSTIQDTYKHQIETAEKYRVSVLKNVSTFSKLTDKYLLSAAHHMEELNLPKGTVIIRQEDVGDSFYVVQEGYVVVTRQSNMQNPNEVPKELATLGPNSYIGEISLLTSETRTASVTVVSPMAKILKMTKQKFEEVMAQCNKQIFNDKLNLGRQVLNRVPLFQSLATLQRKVLLENMRPILFQPNTYICRQGMSGNTFYIIAEGHCKVTVNIGNGAEKDVTRLSVGDFFGEVALIEPNNKRTANVISMTQVSCMTLSRIEFSSLLANVRNSLLEDSTIRSIALRKAKKNITSTKGQIGKRRITVMNESNDKNYLLVPGMLRKFIKSMNESLYLSIYSRFYRELILRPHKAELYGDHAKNIPIMFSSRESAVQAIMNIILAVGRQDANEREPADSSLLYGVLMQPNMLRDKVCRDWPSYQYRLLCRQVRVIRVKPLTKVIEAGSKGSSAYLILRGSVRVYATHGISSQSMSNDGGHKGLKYEEDLFPGQIFAESALDGIKIRLISVQTVTNCDLVVLEYSDFKSASIENTQKESVDDRFQFLSRTALLRSWDGIELYRMATAMTQEEASKGHIIIRKGSISSKLCFLVSGKIDVVVGLGAMQMNHVITTIKKGELFNESGILNYAQSMNNASGVERPDLFKETSFAVCGSNVVVLCLDESKYNMFDQNTLDKILSSFKEKQEWRNSRTKHLRIENKSVLKWKKKIQMERAIEATKWQPPPKLRPKSQAGDLVKSLDDIPLVLASKVDPMLAVSTCRNARESRKLQDTIRELHRPKSARMASTKKFVQTFNPKRSIHEYSRASTCPGLSPNSAMLPPIGTSDRVQPSEDINYNMSIFTDEHLLPSHLTLMGSSVVKKGRRNNE